MDDCENFFRKVFTIGPEIDYQQAILMVSNELSEKTYGLKTLKEINLRLLDLLEGKIKEKNNV